MADKKKITLGELYNLIDEECVLDKRVSLYFEDDGTDNEDANDVWLSGEIGTLFADWTVVIIDYNCPSLKIVIRRPTF